MVSFFQYNKIKKKKISFFFWGGILYHNRFKNYFKLRGFLVKVSFVELIHYFHLLKTITVYDQSYLLFPLILDWKYIIKKIYIYINIKK